MRDWHASAAQTPAVRLVPITASANAIDQTRAIFIDTAGSFTIALAAEAGVDRTITLPAGLHPFSIVKCSAGTGLWAVY